MGLCRTCLAECPLTSADIYQDTDLKDVLSQLIRLEIICDERLPRTLCHLCFDQLQNSQSFIKKAQESNALLCDKINAEVCSNRSNNDALLKIKPKSSNTADKEIQIDNEFFKHLNKSSQTNIENFGLVPSDDDVDDHNGISKSDSHYPKLYECNIKTEPEDYDGNIDSVTELTNGFAEEQELSISQIKIEPLSENDALKFHQSGQFHDSRLTQDISHAESLTDNNAYGQRNGDMEYYLQSSDDESIDVTSNKSIKSSKKVFDDRSITDDRRPCSQCGMVIPKKLINQHREHHGPLIQKCVLCNKRFKTRKRLKMHVVIEHSYYELLKCKVCDMSFMHSVDLQNHSIIHLPSKITYHCSLCNTDYDTEFLLTSHLYIHKEIVVLKKGNDEHLLCSRCNRFFSSSLSLLNHIKSMCKDNSDSQDIVELNGIFEDEEEPDLSEMKIKIEKPTRNHKIDKKPNFEDNACPHCSQTFTNKYFLRIHVENHGSFIRDYCCPICLFKFKRKDHLKRHLTNVHGLTNPRKIKQ